jgi:hypothetical protein
MATSPVYFNSHSTFAALILTKSVVVYISPHIFLHSLLQIDHTQSTYSYHDPIQR